MKEFCKVTPHQTGAAQVRKLLEGSGEEDLHQNVRLHYNLRKTICSVMTVEEIILWDQDLYWSQSTLSPISFE